MEALGRMSMARLIHEVSELFSSPSVHIGPLLHRRINLSHPRQPMLDIDLLHWSSFQRPHVVQRADLNSHDRGLWRSGVALGMRLAVNWASTVSAESYREIKPFVKVLGSNRLEFSLFETESTDGDDEVERPGCT